jgi:hypothetical protein
MFSCKMVKCPKMAFWYDNNVKPHTRFVSYVPMLIAVGYHKVTPMSVWQLIPHFTTFCILSLTWKYNFSFDMSVWTMFLNIFLRFLSQIRKTYWKYLYTFLSAMITNFFFVKLESLCDLLNETLFTRKASKYKNGMNTGICVNEIVRRATYFESTKIASATACFSNFWHTEETFQREVCQYSFIL